MANDYYDMTGTLRLKQQTGVIDALFGGLRLESEPAGAISFRCMSEEDTMSWDAIFEALEDLASNLNINAPFGSSTTDDPKGDLLWALAAHFNASQNEELASLIDAGGFDDDASLDALFVLARAFDDGHGLTGIQYEGAWICDKARLGHFGGDGGFIGTQIGIGGSSTQFADLGEAIETALCGADHNQAAELLRKHVGQILAGITDTGLSTAVRLKLAELLQVEPTIAPLVPAPVLKISGDDLRRLLAEDAWNRYTFGDAVRVESVKGWEYATGGSVWSRTLFIQPVDESTDTVKVTFSVWFKAGSASINEVYAVSGDGKFLGALPRTEYYLWCDADCGDKTGDLAEAVQWCAQELAKGRDACIANSDQVVINLDSLRIQPST